MKRGVFRLSLPQMEAVLEREARGEILAVLGGRPPGSPWLRAAASGRAVWAADRGAEACQAAGITPDRAVGDFDSIGEGAAKWLARLGVRTERFPADKDLTDFQLCLDRAEADGGENFLVTGCWGGRFDHAFANIFSALWNGAPGSAVSGPAVLAFADETEVLIPLAGEGKLVLEFHAPALPAALSLLPLTEVCGGVGLDGAKWALRGAELAQSRPCAVSNVPVKDRVTVTIDRGVLGIYCFFDNVSYGLPGGGIYGTDKEGISI